MPSYKQETQEHHKERIRDVLALKPNASPYSIREALQNDPNVGLTLDRHYIGKLLKKIRAERIRRYDEKEVNQRIAEIQDRSETIIQEMWKVILDPSASEKGKVMAANTILQAEHKLLEAQMNAGVFERKLGTVEIEHTHKLPDEVTAPILQALKNYGIVKTKAIVVEPRPIEQPKPDTSIHTGASAEPNTEQGGAPADEKTILRL